MARKYEELRQKMLSRMTQAERKAHEREARRMATEYQEQLDATLADLRKALQVTQATLAERMGVAQSEISRLENRTDMYVSTLRSAIEAMGGELEIRAKFPNHPPVNISQFSPDSV